MGWLNGGVVRFEDIVGKPDELEDILWVEVDRPMVLFSDATGMEND